MLARVVVCCIVILQAHAWVVPVPSTPCAKTTDNDDKLRVNDDLVAVVPKNDAITRRSLLLNGIVTTAAATTFSVSLPAQALVKGVAPPTTKQKPVTDKPKCSNVEECQEMAERKAAAQQQEELMKQQQGGAGATQTLVTSGGVRYRDLEEGTPGAAIVKMGDDVTLYYQVLKLGKRSYDGLSGEGTVVFSRGYGFEDDEDKPGIKSFLTTVGSPQNIKALNEAVVGMKVGSIRRFAIMPQMGWERPTSYCDGGPGGKGAGGTLKTDYVVVPTATMVATEDCLDKSKLPFPTTYAEQRRMAQRFDQSLIMEIQVVDTGPSSLA